MRLIDADRLIDEFEDTVGSPIARTRLKLQVQNQPTIDAVEVVRCKDCKHRFNGEHHDNCCDVLMEKVKWTFEVTVEPDWFCADGERRNDG